VPRNIFVAAVYDRRTFSFEFERRS